MRILAALILFAAIENAHTEEVQQSELQVVGDSTIISFKATDSTFSYGHLMYQSIKATQYALVICAGSQDSAEAVMEEHGAIVLLPGSAVMLRTAIGAKFGDGEIQKIATKFVEVRCEQN